ncbi:hypothetical protein RRG08_019186, partial [Elysia crispata]
HDLPYPAAITACPSSSTSKWFILTLMFNQRAYIHIGSTLQRPFCDKTSFLQDPPLMLATLLQIPTTPAHSTFPYSVDRTETCLPGGYPRRSHASAHVSIPSPPTPNDRDNMDPDNRRRPDPT